MVLVLRSCGAEEAAKGVFETGRLALERGRSAKICDREQSQSVRMRHRLHLKAKRSSFHRYRWPGRKPHGNRLRVDICSRIERLFLFRSIAGQQEAAMGGEYERSKCYQVMGMMMMLGRRND